jgi:hypothetical protein
MDPPKTIIKTKAMYPLPKPISLGIVARFRTKTKSNLYPPHLITEKIIYARKMGTTSKDVGIILTTGSHKGVSWLAIRKAMLTTML